MKKNQFSENILIVKVIALLALGLCGYFASADPARFDSGTLLSSLTKLSYSSNSMPENVAKLYQLDCSKTEKKPSRIDDILFLTEFDALQNAEMYSSDTQDNAYDTAEALKHISKEQVHQVKNSLKALLLSIQNTYGAGSFGDLKILLSNLIKNEASILERSKQLCDKIEHCQPLTYLPAIFNILNQHLEGAVAIQDDPKECLNYFEKSILSYYIGGLYVAINKPEVAVSIAARSYLINIQKKLGPIVQKFPTYNGNVYIGTYLPPSDLKNLKAGDVLPYSHFLSGSFNTSFLSFALNSVLVVKNKTGKNIAPINPAESEVVFQNPRFQIQDIKIDELGKRWFFCREL